MEKHTKIGNLNTAEEILKSKETYDEEYHTVSISDATKAMIEFAKLHVKAALKAKVDAMVEKSYEDSSYSMGELDAFTGDSYPLDNIK
jgi:hypothetical protein